MQPRGNPFSPDIVLHIYLAYAYVYPGECGVLVLTLAKIKMGKSRMAATES